MEKTITVQFGERIVNTGKTTLAEAYEVAVAYGATKKDTVYFRATMTREEVRDAIGKLEYRLCTVGNEIGSSWASGKINYGTLNAIKAEQEALKGKIARMRDLYRNYDYIINA